MMLVESISKDPLGFQILRFDNQKVNYTVIVSNLYHVCFNGNFYKIFS